MSETVGVFLLTSLT